jgi:hypothetical protein
MNLIEIQDKLKGVPLPMLDAASKGQLPHVPPYLAAAEMASRQRSMQSAQQSQQAAQAPQGTTVDVIKQGLGAMIQQQTAQAQQMQQLQQQMGQQKPLPVTAARGGLMSVARFSGGGEVPRPAQRPGESFSEYRKRLFQWELETTKARDARTKAERERAREAERQRLLAERGGAPLIPPSPFLDGRSAPTPNQRGAENRTAMNRVEQSMRAAPAAPAGLEGLKIGAKPDWLSQEAYDGQVQTLMSEYRRAMEKGDSFAAQNLLKELAQIGGVPASPGPGGRTRPTPPPTATAAAPSTQPTLAQPGIAGLTTDAVAAAQQQQGQWGGRLNDTWGQIGTNAPDIRALEQEAAQVAAKRKALFDAEQGNSLERWLLAGQGDNDFERIMGLTAHSARERLRQPQFDLSETETATGEAAKRREMERGYKEGAVKQRGDIARPMAEREMADAESMRREQYKTEQARIDAEKAFERQQMRDREQFASNERVAGMRGAGAGGASGLTDDAIRAVTALRETVRKTLEKNLNYVTATPEQQQQMEDEVFRRELGRRPELLSILPQLQALQSGGTGASGAATPTGVDLSKWGSPKVK